MEVGVGQRTTTAVAVEQHPGTRSATARRGGTRRLGRPRPDRGARAPGLGRGVPDSPAQRMPARRLAGSEFGKRYGCRLNAAVAQRVEDPMRRRSGWRTPHFAGTPLTIRSPSTAASRLGWVNIGPGVECTAWIQRAGVARTARTTVGQASSSWSARCSRIVLSSSLRCRHWRRGPHTTAVPTRPGDGPTAARIAPT